ncbi:hypothetical protein BJV82DRAFT_676902 [Fennellomyces sp. T-0311]|nr:hypothetical protein BJV82DRAFT_676902 [Fennellomyces sp. T-0311]
MSAQCEACGARVWPWESSQLKNGVRSYGVCCNFGKVDLPSVEAPPEPLQRLLNGTDNECKVFRLNLHKYNNAFALASLNVQLDPNYANGVGGAYAFQIQGTVYHHVGPLFPQNNEVPRLGLQLL